MLVLVDFNKNENIYYAKVYMDLGKLILSKYFQY